MAKQPKTDFIDEPSGPSEQPPGEDAAGARIRELEARLAGLPTLEQARAMSDRIEELELQLERSGQPLPAERGPPGPSTGYWKVELEHAPTRVVAAADPANAWERYKYLLGVIGSEYGPQVTGSSQEEYRAQEEELARQRGQK